MASLEEATSLRSPAGEASMTPAAETPSTVTQRSARWVSISTTSKSSTRVSAISTRERITEPSRVISVISAILHPNRSFRSMTSWATSRSGRSCAKA